MFRITKINFISVAVALLYLLVFSYATSEIEWYNIPNAWIWLAVIPAGLGMWIKDSTR